MASIVSDDALILLRHANPHGWIFQERQHTGIVIAPVLLSAVVGSVDAAVVGRFNLMRAASQAAACRAFVSRHDS